MNPLDYTYDLAISFAGEDRSIAEALAHTLRKRGLRVFYDRFEKSNLWGKDLIEYLANVYGKESRYCLIIISKHYPIKNWPKYELKWAHDRQLQSRDEYLLPLRVDDTEIPGLPSTVAYLDWREETFESVCQAIADKLHLQASEDGGGEEAQLAVSSMATHDFQIIRNDLRLLKLETSNLAAIAQIPGVSIIERLRSTPEHAGGCYLSVNHGENIQRIWAYMAPDKTVEWGRSMRFHEPQALVSSISDDVSCWVASGKIWLRIGANEDPHIVDVPYAAEPKPSHLAVLRQPPRLAFTSDKRIYLFDYESRTLLAETEVPNSYTGHSVDNMWFSDQGFLVTGKYASQVIWSNADLQKVLDLQELGITAHYVSHANAFDKTGKLFACIGMGQHIVIVSVKNKRVMANNFIPGDGVGAGADIAFHPAYSNLLFCVNGSGEVVVWNGEANSTKILAVENKQWSCCFFPSYDILATVDVHGECTSWFVEFLP